MLHKKKNKKNLKQLKTRFQDLGRLSPNFFNITFMPDSLSAGKTAFKFRPISNRFSKQDPIQVEILDSNGDVVYHEIVQYRDNDGSLIISAYVYEDTAAGFCTITFVGTSLYDENLVPISKEEITPYNIKYVHSIYIDPEQRNNSSVIYTNEPKVTIRERQFSLIEERTTDTHTLYAAGFANYSIKNGKPKLLSSTYTFKREYKNAIVRFNSLSSEYSPLAPFQTSSFEYSASIESVRTPHQLELSIPAKIYGTDGQSQLITEILNQPYEVTFSAQPVSRNVTQNIKTYAEIDISGLEPAVGAVNRIKVFAKSSSKPKSEYQLVYDDEIEARNILVYTGSNLIELPIGTFDGDNQFTWARVSGSQNINTKDYWFIEQINEAPSGSKLLTSDRLFDTIEIVPSLTMSGSSELLLVQSSSAATHFYKDTEYKLLFDYDIIGNTSDTRGSIIAVYFSGSAFVDNTPIGKYVDTIPTGSHASVLKLDHEMKIPVDNDGTGVVKFLLRRSCKISNVRIVESIESGFTPNRTKIYVPIKQDHKNEFLDFKIQFFNYTLSESNVNSILTNVFFTGSNTYIVGDDNIITGSTVISPFTQSGILQSSRLFGLPNFYRSGSMMQTYGYGGIEDTINNFNTSSTDQFGFAFTQGDPYDSGNYSFMSVQMINECGNLFDFRSKPASFDLVLGGRNSSMLVGRSGSAVSMDHFSGDGNVLENCFDPACTSESYMRWDGCRIVIKGAVDENGVPYLSGTNGTSGTGSGTPGSSGSSGTSATAGSSGTSATAGSSGTSSTGGTGGSSGTSATAGSSGTSATAGSSGTSATAGSSGTSATAGSSGTSATAGSSGTSATAGSSGSSGTSATAGSSGTSATAGSSGSSGTSATAGSSGTSATAGSSGQDGSSGSSGQDGSSGSSGQDGSSGSSGTSFTCDSLCDCLSKLRQIIYYINNPTFFPNPCDHIIPVIGNLTTGFSYPSDTAPTGSGGLNGTSSLDTGSFYYNTSSGSIYVWNGLTWIPGFGSSGTAGTSATAGSSGTSATAGSSGTSATAGSSGTSATAGSSGTSATAGSSGTSATAGSSGTSATAGSSGQTVVGSSGTAGTSATAGSSGTSATSGKSPSYLASSTDSVDISSLLINNTVSFTASLDKAYTSGEGILVYFSSTEYFKGLVTNYNPLDGGIDITVKKIVGSGTHTSWTLNLDGSDGTAGTSATAGSSGTSATAGSSGTSATAGSSGTSATAGSSGTSATAGSSGTSATAGSSGTSATAGSSGTSATAGSSGATVVGSSGTSATAGSSGIFGGDSQKYLFTSSIDVSDPTNGYLKFDDPVLANVGKIFIDDQNFYGVNISASWIGSLDDSTNGRKGTLRLFSEYDASKYVIYSIIANNTLASGYTIILVQYVDSNGLFSDDEPIVITFSQSGNAGSSGTSATAGSSGTSATAGSSGTSATAGSSGTSATAGSSGTSATAGSSGTSATAGSSGTSATAGSSGTSATAGSSGTSATAGSSGETIVGSSGTAGTSATAGSSGTSATAGSSGKTPLYLASSTDSVNISSLVIGNTVSFTASLDRAYTTGEGVLVYFSSTEYFKGLITNYNPLDGGIDITVKKIVGSGTHTSWTLNLDGSDGTAGTSATAGSSGITVSGTSGTSATAGSSGTAGTSGQTQSSIIVLSAAGGWGSVTNGASGPTRVELTGSLQNLQTLDFPDGSKTYAEWTVFMPPQYSGGTVTAQFVWTSNSASAADVVWLCQGRIYADGHDIDQAWGTAQKVTDSNTAAAYKLRISSTSSAITLGGSPAASQMVQFRVYRDPTDVSDTLAADAKLIMVIIAY